VRVNLRALLVHALDEQAKAFWNLALPARICATGRSYSPISRPNDSPCPAALQPEKSL